MRNLKYLAPFSTIANCVTIVSFGIIAYYIFRDPIELEGRRAVGSLAEFPLFFGTVLFALEAIGVVSRNTENINETVREEKDKFKFSLEGKQYRVLVAFTLETINLNIEVTARKMFGMTKTLISP